ncbi:hypothetical protein HMPREF0645_1780 [Hallella bergensis DSM 17361]|uniref:Uncharacterized protein n=1 Tax=Hallella bergensis DSM 17361 TaxID=585502 RepID=D1PXU5_9BACT|nr:hypothetical protein HMPREF0645_1780 [Hallella bergensis DSM 17361]
MIHTFISLCKAFIKNEVLVGKSRYLNWCEVDLLVAADGFVNVVIHLNGLFDWHLFQKICAKGNLMVTEKHS